MSGRFVLAPEAAFDLYEIWRYLKDATSADLADRVVSTIRDKFVFLARTPGAGHTRRDLADANTRFFPVYSYLIVYRPETKPLQIFAVLRGRRDVERALERRR
jgi:toxin ParE1/3/4